MQSSDNKQGRSDKPMEKTQAEKIRAAFAEDQKAAYTAYNSLVSEGLARELARINLPLSLYTEWYWQIDLHNLFHFLELRLDEHAQKEIRLYAKTLFEIAKKVAPSCCDSFGRYILGGVRFSAEELVELRKRLDHKKPDNPNGITADVSGGLSGKALDRFEEKLKTGRQL
jgi:thymidylate synthase (FAD)